MQLKLVNFYIVIKVLSDTDQDFSGIQIRWKLHYWNSSFSWMHGKLIVCYFKCLWKRQSENENKQAQKQLFLKCNTFMHKEMIDLSEVTQSPHSYKSMRKLALIASKVYPSYKLCCLPVRLRSFQSSFLRNIMFYFKRIFENSSRNRIVIRYVVGKVDKLGIIKFTFPSMAGNVIN